MAEIIKKVAPRTEEVYFEGGVSCPNCGCGWSGDDQEPRRCEYCNDGSMMQPYPGFTQTQHDRGYAVVRCDCGNRVETHHHFLNPCYSCGADYDGSGNRLAPREFWGEETGESLADILGPGNPDEVWG